MNKHRPFIEIVLLGTLIAFSLALVIAILGVAAGAAEGHGQQEGNSKTAQHSYEGMLTCSRCGAKHSAAFGRTATACARVCVRGGAKFVLVQAESTYILDGDPVELTRVAGERVRVIGSMSGNRIKVESVIPGAVVAGTQ
jgi:hypothetical protein